MVQLEGVLVKSVGQVIFDISDVVKYAVGNSSVSGIQRVQLKIISEYCVQNSAGNVLVSFRHPESGVFSLIDPRQLFTDVDFNSEKFLARLGLLTRRFFPEKFRVKRYLKQFETNKLRRGLEKLRIYAMSFVCRNTLREWKVLSEPGVAGIPEVARRPMASLDLSDTYVLLGSFWDYEEVMQKARDHHLAGGRTVVLVHDLIPLVAQNYSTAGLTKVFKGFAHKIPGLSGTLLAVSQYSAWDAERVLDLSRDTVKPLRLAHEFSGFPRHHRVVQHRLNLPEAFALCVGTIEIRKNGLLLLQVWKRLINEGVSNLPSLVFAGKYGWRISEFKGFLAAHPEVASKVVVINSPNDEGLAELYSRAKFCLFPSFYEGWGLPVGEAAWFDRYVIASSASSVPEVCGDLMDYGAPDDLKQWVALVRRAVREPAYVAQKEAIIRAAHLRTWSDVAAALRDIIESPVVLTARS